MFFRRKSPDRNSPTRSRERQPLGGQQTPAIFSYYARRDQQSEFTVRDIDRPREEAATPERSSGQRTKPTTIVLLVALGLLIVWQLLLTGSPQVTISGSSAKASLYAAQATDMASGSLFSHTKLTVNTVAIDKKIQARYPELSAVSTTVPLFGNSLHITIIPPAPAVIYTASNGQLLVLDKNGRDITQSAGDVTRLSIPRVRDQNNTVITDGGTILPASTLNFVLNVTYQLNAANLKPTSLTLASGGGELDIGLPGRAYIAKCNLQEDARLQAGTLIATVVNLQRQHITPSKYIDVRVPGRAYYQ